MRCATLLAISLAALTALAEPPKRLLFHTHERCFACHNHLAAPSGEDISIGFEWSATMMANSARDPYWQAGVRRETIDHPRAVRAIEAECSICHMPMARYEAVLAGGEGEVFAHTGFNPAVRADQLAADGVSCSLCHQITAEKLGTRESFVGRFVIAAQSPGLRPAFGPLEVDAGRTRIMSSSSGFRPTYSTHIRQSELCATCHTLFTHSLDAEGKVIGEFPEQVPYLEWRHSRYREAKSCQACHMPSAAGPAPVSSVLSLLRPEVSRHSFPGGNFLMQRVLNRFRNELAVRAPAQQMERVAQATLEHLSKEAARLAIENPRRQGERLNFAVRIENLAGHKLPTAYPSRRVWVEITVQDGDGRLVFRSGGLSAEGAIEGNDNDSDPQRWEPHYREIRSPDQVQIYEAIMGASDGSPTTGLLMAVRYLKDNRLLPHGFDKRTAPKEIAVWGEAAEDPDFLGGSDRLEVSVELAGRRGPYRIEAVLWYQPVAYRWAANLRSYKAFEPERFGRYFTSIGHASAARLARASSVY